MLFLLHSFAILPALASGFGLGSDKIPTSPAQRNTQMARAIQAALASPRVPSFQLLECEFPAVASLNKLGDGSLQSAQAVDTANLLACSKLVEAISFPPFVSPPVWLVASSTATNSFIAKAKKNWSKVHSLRDGQPYARARDVFVFVTPAGSSDYQVAKRLANNGNKVILVNGFAKDTKSVPGEATMAYFLKPLTYNSQVAGYLTRTYPGPWTVQSFDGSKLATFKDEEILVPGTNTPDLRQSVRLVQKEADEQAIQLRSSR